MFNISDKMVWCYLQMTPDSSYYDRDIFTANPFNRYFRGSITCFLIRTNEHSASFWNVGIRIQTHCLLSKLDTRSLYPSCEQRTRLSQRMTLGFSLNLSENKLRTIGTTQGRNMLPGLSNVTQPTPHPHHIIIFY